KPVVVRNLADAGREYLQRHIVTEMSDAERGDVQIVPSVFWILVDTLAKGVVGFEGLAVLLFSHTQQTEELWLGHSSGREPVEDFGALPVLPILKVGQSEAVVAAKHVGIALRQCLKRSNGFAVTFRLAQQPGHLELLICRKTWCFCQPIEFLASRCSVPRFQKRLSLHQAHAYVGLHLRRRLCQ